jgi:hypothetical protein
MGKSCVYYSENIDTYHVAMDNLVIAKRLYDLGKKLPGNYVFTMDRVSDRYDSFFLQGLELLTGSEADIVEDYGDDYTFHLELPEVVRWMEIERKYPEAAVDREWILEPVSSEEALFCEYTGVEVEMEMTETGFAFHVMGVGSYYLIFERICDCYFRLQQKITQWDAKEENHDRVAPERNNHSVARERKGQHEIGTCC